MSYATNNASVHNFSITTIDGKTIELSRFQGKKILIVNTASKCGFTKQLGELEELYTMKKESMIVIGFPSGDFGNQEFEDNAEIETFCAVNFRLSFPLSQKVHVSGQDTDLLFRFLCNGSENKVADTVIRWNFTKFLVDENGVLIKSFPPPVSPLAEEILNLL